MTTLWKPERLPSVDEFDCRLEPIGHPVVVLNMLMSISGMRPCFDLAGRGYVACQWKDVVLGMKEEPEYGPGGVFSIVVQGRDRVKGMDFYLLYLQAHELLGVWLLEEDRFITPRELRRKA